MTFGNLCTLRAGKRNAADCADRFAHEQSGSMVVFTLFILAMMLMVGGMAVDMMRFENYRARLQNAMDRAVLAAADLDACLDPEYSPEATVTDFIAKAGFESQIDPKNPNIIYAQSQYGGLVRYDKASGESVGIQPLPRKGENSYRWNWDAPLAVSHHQDGRLYFAANKLFVSNDRGNSWEVISEDLTSQINRNDGRNQK